MNTSNHESQALNSILELTSMYRTYCSEYVFMANEKHKELKDVWKEAEQEKDSIDLEKLEMALTNLEKYLYYNMQEFLGSALRSCIYPLFKDRSKIEPRVAVKVIFDSKIVSLYRFPDDSAYAHDSIKINDFSPFSELIEKPLEKCIFNNIPVDFISKKYSSTRINMEKALKYVSKKSTGYDDEWAACWEEVMRLEDNQMVSPPVSSCYKSTMIVPINISMGMMGAEFRSHLSLDGNQEWVFLGFLCFDHPNVDFFDINIDYSVACILSNLLSPYLMQHFTHTQYSNMHKKVRSLLSTIPPRGN